MSVHAGSIIHLGGNNVIDRIQSAGLGDVRLPVETIREVGNREVVDKVPGEPDFTFTLEGLNTSVELMAWLTGKVGGPASGASPGAADADGTEYNWLDCGFVNIPSPWKDPTTGSAGIVEAGHLIPGYYPTRLTYRFGVTDNATQSVELAGGAFYYAKAAPREEYFNGNGATTAFITTDDTVHYRKGGQDGTTFMDVFGVIVDGQLQTLEVDYTVTGGDGSPATITFTDPPPAGVSNIRVAYFTDAAKSYPQTVHASSVVLPGAVRGKNIRIEIDGNRVGGGQTFELEATVDGEVERELGNEEIVGRTINGTDTNGTFTIRAKDADAFFNLLEDVTGVAQDEVYGWFNDKQVELAVKIENPKNPGQIIKTILIKDAKFQPPGTPARVNSPTDFAIQWESVNGTFVEVKGEPA
jgi:hypothetical protein